MPLSTRRIAELAALLAIGLGLVFTGCGSSESTSGASMHARHMAAKRGVRQHAQLRHQMRAMAHRAVARRTREAHRALIRREYREEAEARELAQAETREREEAEAPEEAESSECDPNYSGACLDPYASDYDCEGGSGNGPDYTGTVAVVGDDHYGLDADGDGVGCEIG